MEFKPLIDYAKAPERRSIDVEATKAFRAMLLWSLVFACFMVVLAMAGSAGYFN